MLPDLSDLIITPNYGIFRVVDISCDSKIVLCIDGGGALLEIPTDSVVCLKHITNKVDYEKLQCWFLLSSISLN